MARKATTELFKNRIIGYATKPADQFQANPLNYRKHPQRQRDAVNASLRELGWISTVVENVTTGNVIDGHERIWQALQNNEDVPYLQVELSEAEERLALAIFDPITSMAETDAAILDDLLREVNTGEAALQQVLADLADAAGLYGDKGTEGDTPAETDRAEELRQKWGTSAGQLWQLGEHRLVCGDCTDAATVARVMGGERAALMLTDPPYMGALGGNPFPTDAGLKARTEKLKASIDHLYDFDPSEFLKSHLREFCANKAAFMFWCNKVQLPIYMRYAVDNDFRWYLLTWHKPNFIPMNNGKYYPDTEYLFKLSDTGATFNTGIPKEQASYNTYWIEEMGSGGGGHPTEKPLRPHLDQIQICTNAGDIVADPFSGSGTTIIACENLSRRCRACEISPGYVGVALERYFQHTGVQPVLLESAAR